MFTSLSDLVFSVTFWLYLLAAAGIWAVFCFLVDNFKSLVQITRAVLVPFFIPSSSENKSLSERFGQWAVITGSTDGIGRQYALELAKQGINIVLISRTEAKLVQVANDIESKYSVKTKYIVADFSQGKKIYDTIKLELANIPVGILVNNVGRMYDFPDELDNVNEDLLWEIININVGAVTMMSRMIIPKMKKNRKGAIVNISSGSELQPIPLMAVYGASKVFIKNFTLAISKELEPFNIFCQLVTPMFVQTKMNDYSSSVMRGNILVPDVEAYAKSAVFTLGKSEKTTGYYTHGIQYGVMKLAPEWLRTLISMDMNKKFREEYYQIQKDKVQ